MAKLPKSFSEVEKGYRNLWNKAFVRPERHAAVTKITDKYYANIARYHAVEQATGVPSWWVFCTHIRESSGSFAGVLHNGDQIIGTGRKTYRVPAGRGPFSTWQEAAIDALQLKGLHKIGKWDAARSLYEFERYNGFGYFGKGVNSSYVWADTNLEQKGKYVADHVWDATFDDPQVGTAALLKVLCERSPAINAAVNGGAAVTPAPNLPAVIPPPTQPDLGPIIQHLNDAMKKILTARDELEAKQSGKTAGLIVQEREGKAMSSTDTPQTAVVDVKPWYASKTVWLAVIAALAPLVSVVSKGSINIDPSTQDWIAGIISVLAGFGAAATRITADTVMPAGASRAGHG